tara:strand:+ start:203 stop:745 length:543 start_codon:yes stop_codon:yes gene_type:complete
MQHADKKLLELMARQLSYAAVKVAEHLDHHVSKLPHEEEEKENKSSNNNHGNSGGSGADKASTSVQPHSASSNIAQVLSMVNTLEDEVSRKPLEDIHLSDAVPPMDLNSGTDKQHFTGVFNFPFSSLLHSQPSTAGLEGPATDFPEYVPANLLSVPDKVDSFADASVRHLGVKNKTYSQK